MKVKITMKYQLSECLKKKERKKSKKKTLLKVLVQMQTRTLTFGCWECEFGTATLETNVAVSYKIRHTIAMQPSNPTPWYLSKTSENYVSHKNLDTNVYCRFICNRSKTVKPWHIRKWNTAQKKNY